MKNILIISTSPRQHGNSDMLARQLERGAREAGNNVEYVTLCGKKIAFCQGCMACQKTHRCVINDDALEICQKMHDADVIVWATPVYYYSCSGQMKTMIDRANPLYNSDYHFTEVYLLATAAEDEPSAFLGTLKVVEGWVDCFKRAEIKAALTAGGVYAKGEIEGHYSMKDAYEIGKNIK